MALPEEPVITINGTVLSQGQAMTVRVALSDFAAQLTDKAYLAELGEIGPPYKARIIEILKIMNSPSGLGL